MSVDTKCRWVSHGHVISVDPVPMDDITTMSAGGRCMMMSIFTTDVLGCQRARNVSEYQQLADVSKRPEAQVVTGWRAGCDVAGCQILNVVL